jgi:hypothetical protein
MATEAEWPRKPLRSDFFSNNTYSPLVDWRYYLEGLNSQHGTTEKKEICESIKWIISRVACGIRERVCRWSSQMLRERCIE